MITTWVDRLRSAFGSLHRRTGRSRWQDTRELLPEWEERTKLMAEFVPEGCHLIEFGAGRRSLPHFLPSSCRYTPSDFIDRGPGTLILDLNHRPLPDLRHIGADTAVFGGVLEYLNDLESVVPWLARQFSRCIASYEISRTRRNDPGREAESRERKAIGWVNTFHEDEFLNLFAAAGFRLVQTRVWHTDEGDEPIFVFEKAGSGAP